MADYWSRGLRSDGGGITTPRAGKSSARRATGEESPHPYTSDAMLESASKRPTPACPPRAPGAKTPNTPQAALKPPLPATAKMASRIVSRVPSLSLSSRAGSVEASDDEESPRSRVNSISADGSQMEDVMEGDSVQVFVRVRPCNETELEASGASTETPCMRTSGENTIVACIPGKNPKHYTYDKVLMESACQHDVFEAAGVPMVDNCMSGYNSSIFVYGQTGAGKTHTMMGDLSTSGEKRSEQRGLAPRMIELLFEKIGDAENTVGRDSLRYSCRCSCLEIYNETITDLLNPAASSLQMREDPARGIYVDELSEKEVFNAEDVMALMWKGNKNRHVGETNMNARSSRSHCVFTCVVERTSKNTANGVTSVVGSRLNLIDLAGSERIKGGALGGSNAQGEHFKEAVHINQSLTTLGRVIMELVEAQKGGRHGQGHHIPYRDSRLTFLLQDSLGGNAKTMIIANVSPSPACAAETVSTLKFVARAKCIRNKAMINLDYRGDVSLLQKEIGRLNVELDNLRKGFTDPAIQENKELRQRIKSAEKQRDEDELRMQGLATENARFKKEAERMKARLLQVDEGSQGVSSMMDHLHAKLRAAEEAEASLKEASVKVQASLQEEAALWRRRAESATSQLQQLQASNLEQQRMLQQAREQLQNELMTTTKLVQCLERETATLKNQAEEAEEAKAMLAVLYAEAREKLEVEKGTSAEALASVARLEAQVLQLGRQCEALGSSVGQEQQALQALQSSSVLQLSALAARLEEARTEAAARGGDAAAARAEAEARGAELTAVKELLAAEQEAFVRAKSGLIDRAAEQERKLRGELEHNVREQQSLRLQLAESELLLVSERGRVAGLQAELAAAAQAQAEAGARVGELGKQVQRMEAAAVEAEGRLALARQQGEELQQLLEGERELRGREQEERRREVERMEAVAVEAEGQLVLARQKGEELQQLLEGERELRGREQEERRGEAQRMEAAVVEAEGRLEAARQQGEELQQLLGSERELRSQEQEERRREVQRMEAAAVEAEGRLNAARQQGEELQQLLEGERELRGREQEEHRGEVERLGGELLGLQRVLGEMKERKEALEVLAAEQEAAVAALRRQAEEAAAKHAAAISELVAEKGMLARTIEELSAGNAELGGCVAAKVAAAEALHAELEAGKKALEAAGQKLHASSSEVQSLRQRLSDAAAQQQESEALAAEQQDRIRGLQRELIGTQEQLAAREFELGSRAAAAERLRRDLAAVQAQLEAKTTELSDFRNMLAQREAEVAEAQQELKATSDGKNDMENQIKGFLLTNTRQARAFQEIRRLINWATTPTSSVTSSLAHHESGTPTGLVVGGGGDDGLQSPTASTEPGVHMKAGPSALGLRRQSRTDEVDQPRGLVGGKKAGEGGGGGSSFARRRSLDLGDEGSPREEDSVMMDYSEAEMSREQSAAGLSPGGSVRSKRLLVLMEQEQGVENDVLSPVAAACSRDQLKCL